MKAGPTAPLPFDKACARMRRRKCSACDPGPDYGATVTGRRRPVAHRNFGGIRFAEVRVNAHRRRQRAAHRRGPRLRTSVTLLIENQITAASSKGLSYAVRGTPTVKDWTHLNGNFERGTKVAGALDVPESRRDHFGGSARTFLWADAGRSREPATVPTAAAIANAVYNAIGVRSRAADHSGQVLAALASAGNAMNSFTLDPFHAPSSRRSTSW